MDAGVHTGQRLASGDRLSAFDGGDVRPHGGKVGEHGGRCTGSVLADGRLLDQQALVVFADAHATCSNAERCPTRL